MKAKTATRRLITCSLLTALLPFASYAQQWHQVPAPNAGTVENWLRGISGTSASDVWAVGHTETNTGLSNYTSDNVILHWSGTGWTSLPVPHPGTDINELWSVAAVSPTQAWAVGDYTMGTNLQLLKWDGTSWTQQNLGSLPDETFLRSVSAVSASDVWAVGGKSPTGSTMAVQQCMAFHYNGSSWTQVSVPDVGTFRNRFNAVHGIAANDAWAAGTWGDSYGDFKGLLMHWNGSNWSNSPLPAVFTEIWDVKMVGANDVWAIGEKASGGAYHTLHWNGNSWTEYSVPGEDSSVFTVALAAKPNHEVYAMGNHIHKWNGSSWIIVDSLSQIPYANVKAATVLPATGEIWAAGRYFDPVANFYKNLVLRSDTSSTGPTGIHGVTARMTSATAGPNPFQYNLEVHVSTQTAAPAEISLTDLTGKVVLRHPCLLAAGENDITLPAAKQLADGVYLLEIKTGGEALRLKLVKE